MILRATAWAAVLIAAAAGGCAHVSEPAPRADHPANVGAAQAPMPERSTTPQGEASPQVPAPPTAYTCPHHPKVMQAEPGECPYCGMELVPTESRQTSPLRGVNPSPPPPGAQERTR
jgi:hypothetical protein